MGRILVAAQQPSHRCRQGNVFRGAALGWRGCVYLATRLLRPPIEFDVRVEGGQMLVKGGNFPRVPVFSVPGKPDRFSYENAPAELQFERDAGGSATALVLHENGALRALKVAASP